MSWSARLGRIFGIPVRVHWTMLLLLLVFSWSSGLGGMIAAGISLVLLFGSVLAHELGHALTARAFGIGTSEILLLPIGGVAKIEQEPRSGRQEVVIAGAGPLVSLCLAGLAALPTLLVGPVGVLHGVGSMLMWSNLMLGLFNLLPAFPLDGGRILRGALRERRGMVAATRIAASIGRWLALPMALAGVVWGSVSLVVIAAFVWLAGRSEQRLVEARAASAGYGGWRMPSDDPRSRLGVAGGAPDGYGHGVGSAGGTASWQPRHFVIEAGPFGYVIRQL
jgi:Zn-dependent protease